eukprot:s320_g29.t1
MPATTAAMSEYYRHDGVRITHDPYAPGMAEKYGMPGKTDNEGFDPYADTVGPGIYGGIVKRDENGQIVIGRQYQNHNPRPGPVYAGGGYTPINEALRKGPAALKPLLDKYPDLVNDISTGGATPLHMCGMAEFKEWKAVPVTEVLPSEISKVIRRIASQTSGGVVIEMQWGSSAYLPAHNGGQKYRDCAQRLQELISGRLSRGSPLPVHIVDKPIRFSKRSSGIYDQYSDWERAWDLVESNRSYAAAPASRVGAFEVHLVQSNWSPKLCAGKLERDQSHEGPAVSGSWGILCSACAQRAEGHQVAGGLRTGIEQYEQHTLLHSKLWTRHWPDFWSVLGKIGALVIQEAPAVQKPVLLKPISFAKKQRKELRPCSFASRQMMIGSGVPDRRPAIEQELSDLIAQDFSSCSCGQWRIVGERSKVVVEEALHQHGVSSPCTVTLLWGQNGSPYKSDLDLMTWVDGTKLFYGTEGLQVGNCKLDFDRNAGEGDLRKDPAENISLGQTGTFAIQVTNFCDRDNADIPFKVLVRRSGQVSEAEIYDRVWKRGRQKDDPIEVCTVTVSEEDLKVKAIQLQRVQTCDYALSKCSCGHKLELHKVTSILQNHGFEGQDFESFAARFRDEWDGRDLRAFIGHFVEGVQGSERERSKQKEEVAQQRFLELRDACIGEENLDRDISQVEAEKIYVQLCLFLVRKVPEHNLDLSRLQWGEASAQEAHETLMTAVQLNEERKRKLSSWLDEVNSWRSPAELFDAILPQRPDIDGLIPRNETAEEEALDAEIARFGAKIEEASRTLGRSHRKYDRPDVYQSQIHQLTDKFDARLADRRDNQHATEYLIKRGAKVETLDTYGMTPLHRMASNNLPVGAKALLEAKADPNNRGQARASPMEIAKDSRAREVMAVIAEYMSKPQPVFPQLRVSNSGVASVNAIYIERDPKVIPVGFSLTCSEQRWDAEKMWLQLSDQKTAWYEAENGAYIYWNKGDGQWWIDAPDGKGVYITKAPPTAVPQDGWRALPGASAPLPSVQLLTGEL